jgi:Hemolysins and related proteins containing CBS domains
MDINQIIEIIVKLLIVAALVFMNGFFVAAEFALVKVRDTQLDVLINKGNKRAKIARIVVQNLDSSLSACQLESQRQALHLVGLENLFLK